MAISLLPLSLPYINLIKNLKKRIRACCLFNLEYSSTYIISF